MANPASDLDLSLCLLMDPEILADPYPLYRRLRAEDPVHWDPFLHAWVVTRYADVIAVLHKFSADRLWTPEELNANGLAQLTPIRNVMVRQMLFMDPPSHTLLRGLAATAFSPSRVAALRDRIQAIADRLIDAVAGRSGMDLVTDFANPLPAIITAEMLGVPVEHHAQLRAWSTDFAEIFGNFHHNPIRVAEVLRSVEDMIEYFRAAVREQEKFPREGLIHSLLSAEVDGKRLSEEDVISTSIITMIGGQETTTNLIGSGMLTLLQHPRQLEQLRSDPSLIPSAVEELLRYESPIQHTARVAPYDVEIGGKKILKGQSVMAVMAAGNRDPERFPDPDKLDLTRTDNRHLAFGWAAHFCFGAPLARMEAQIAFETLLRRLPALILEDGPTRWRHNLGLRGLTCLPVRFQDTFVAAADAMQ